MSGEGAAEVGEAKHSQKKKQEEENRRNKEMCGEEKREGRSQRQQKQIQSTINGTHKHTESQATEQTVGMRVGKVGESG